MNYHAYHIKNKCNALDLFALQVYTYIMTPMRDFTSSLVWQAPQSLEKWVYIHSYECVHFYIVLQKIKHRNVTFFHYTKEARRESAGGPEKEIKHIYAEPMRATLGQRWRPGSVRGIVRDELAVVQHDLLGTGDRERDDAAMATPSPGRAPTAAAWHPSFRLLAVVCALHLRRWSLASSTHILLSEYWFGFPNRLLALGRSERRNPPYNHMHVQGWQIGKKTGFSGINYLITRFPSVKLGRAVEIRSFGGSYVPAWFREREGGNKWICIVRWMDLNGQDLIFQQTSCLYK
jgi:hypothetical protein